MKGRCEEFRRELEAALAGPAGALARLVGHDHARECRACRVELEAERGLDALLARAAAPAVPPALPRRVLAALAASRSALDDGELEDLLERLPAPRAPAGLSRRVLQALAPVRAPHRRRTGARRWLVAGAAVLLAWLALWAWLPSELPPAGGEVVQEPVPGPEELEADEELLLYTVERWELLNDADLDVWLASLDPLDELLIEYSDGEALLEDEPRARRE